MRTRITEHRKRHVDDLAGVWSFSFLGDVSPDHVGPEDLGTADLMAVPGSFDAVPQLAGKRGLAAYRRTLYFRDAVPHRLVLDGVHHWCRVVLDGKVLAEHVGGFTCFSVDIADPKPGEAELIVYVDNRIDYDRCPLHLEYFDWYHYGGITRGAELHRLGPYWIEHVEYRTVDHDTRTVRMRLRYTATARGRRVPLTLRWSGGALLEEEVELADGTHELEREFQLEGADLWSPETPVLYELALELGEDDLRDRIGIRTITVSGKNVLLNGSAVPLLGFNRHEAHPQFGHGLPDALMLSDLYQIKDLGSNFVRGSHYPQDRRFLDLCDEMGILVWNEAIGWQHTVEHLTDDAFLDAQKTGIREMVAASVNRPSVIMWGILNESASNNPTARPGYEQLLGLLRELDPSRPVTYASNHPVDDVCFDLADILAVNTYPGWYQGEIEDIPGLLDAIFGRLAEMGQGDKPLVISEIGAGAIPGWRDWNQSRWTEQYQVRLLETVIRHLFETSNRACGLAIWQYCDLRTSQSARKALGRPRDFNNKGIVDEYRRPKLAYDTVRSLFRQIRTGR
jgi:beta-glucuronidase